MDFTINLSTIIEGLILFVLVAHLKKVSQIDDDVKKIFGIVTLHKFRLEKLEEIK